MKLLTNLLFSRHPFSFKIFRTYLFKNPQIQKLREKHHDLAECNEIVYCWIPSHIGIAGNKNVDQKAKDSLNLHPTNILLPYSNFKPFINRYIVNKWQLLWNNSLGNKLFEINLVIRQSQPIVRMSDKKNCACSFAYCIGHTRITHSYLLNERSNHIVLDVMHPLQSAIW